ncbi:hypothetical protein BHE74_00002759 [Ensete ventricosum]|nr:hypothetical protein BHE74_00002759 [Ensete ventricosum]
MSTRRRDRRNPGGPTPTARLPAASSRSHHPLFSWPLILVAFFALAAIVLPLVMYRGGKTGLPEATSAALSVYERGLVKPNVAFQEILALRGLDFIKELSEALHSMTSVESDNHPLELIYVIPAPRSQKLDEYDFGPQDLRQLCDAVDGFSLMTYDFSGPQSPGPNAPLSWIRSSLSMLLGDTNSGPHSHAHKILLGLNFYGNDFLVSEGGGAITGTDYISLLEKHRPVIHWDNTSAEHFFIYSHNNARHAVFYPSLLSLSMRLDEAQVWGAGLSIWEIGQGLDYFFDLL